MRFMIESIASVEIKIGKQLGVLRASVYSVLGSILFKYCSLLVVEMNSKSLNGVRFPIRFEPKEGGACLWGAKVSAVLVCLDLIDCYLTVCFIFNQCCFAFILTLCMTITCVSKVQCRE
jgi:hypothetical protein